MYGKFEPANKVSFSDFARYLENTHKIPFEPIYQKMKKMAQQSMESVFQRMDPNRLDHSFELFGLDYMIDEDYQVKLIEINTNPDITTSCPLLSKLITHLVENTLRLTVDTVFPPPLVHLVPFKKPFVPTNLLQDNKYHLILDDHTDRERLVSLSQSSLAEHLNSTIYTDNRLEEEICQIKEEDEEQLDT